MKRDEMMVRGMDILWLGQDACHDHAVVGGKAANLSRLTNAYRIPPGFCLTTAAFDGVSEDGTQGVGALAGRPFPVTLYGQLSEAYQRLAELCQISEPSVAVRSSAVDEDGSTASFAGQHDTYLNVVGVEAVAGAIMQCWASAGSPRVLAYRRQHGLSTDQVRIAVLIQQLVPAEVSAVVFGANPVTGDPNDVMINASWGLGESVVSGTVTPDSFVLRKQDLTVTSRHIAQKHRMTVATAEQTGEVDVPRRLQTQPALDDSQIVELTRLAIELEHIMGWPVDIECAYHAGQLYLLQCRPVTTLGG
ncbi:MAG: PEP/pyruvate-binding domain-containing protein [bacterium]|nr:PEP/pyruvate-binding domain-containing protein [bacterium]